MGFLFVGFLLLLVGSSFEKGSKVEKVLFTMAKRFAIVGLIEFTLVILVVMLSTSIIDLI